MIRDVLRQSGARRRERAYIAKKLGIADMVRPNVPEIKTDLDGLLAPDTVLTEPNQIADYVAQKVLSEKNVKDVLRYQELIFLVIKEGSGYLPEALTEEIGQHVGPNVNIQLNILDVNFLNPQCLNYLGRRLYSSMGLKLAQDNPMIGQMLRQGRLYDQNTKSFSLAVQDIYPNALERFPEPTAYSPARYNRQPQEPRPLK